MKLTFTEINATKISANYWTSRKFHEALISYNKVIVLFAVKTFKLKVKHKTRKHFLEYIPREAWQPKSGKPKNLDAIPASSRVKGSCK